MHEEDQIPVELREIPADQRSESTVCEVPDRLSGHGAQPTTTLGSSLYPFLLLAIYSAITLTSWILICILRYHPITGPNFYTSKAFTFYATSSTPYLSIRDRVSNVQQRAASNEQYIKAAHILRSIATLFTIPVTTAICSVAAVAYMQQGHLRRNLSLAQTMALADAGWISPRVWFKVLSNSKWGSPALFFAIVLTLFGTVGQVLQEAFVSQKSFRASGNGTTLRLNDIDDIFRREPEVDNSVLRLRSLLTSTTMFDNEPNLWFGGASSQQVQNMQTLIEPSYLPDTYYDHDPKAHVFVSELPAAFSTGIVDVPQYAPHIYSSAAYQNITAQEFGANCRNDSTGLFAQYQHTYSDIGYSLNITVCMAFDHSKSVWQNTRDRQDMIETMYLGVAEGYELEFEFYKTTVNTTLGFFEIPSERNGNVPGPVVSKDPLERSAEYKTRITQRDTDNNLTYSGNYTLHGIPNKGPLLSLALALFGQGSYFEKHLSHPDAYELPRPSTNSYHDVVWCNDPVPFSFLGSGGGCYGYGDYRNVLDYVESFTSSPYGDAKFAKLLPAGIFLANKMWLTQSRDGYETNVKSLEIGYDDGVAVTIPTLPFYGLVVGSILLGLHLLGLFALAIYAYLVGPWASSLDAFAMMRIGAAYADRFPLQVGKKTGRMKFLHELPGFIGDGTPHGEVGNFEMGATEPLRRRDRYGTFSERKGRKYTCFPGDASNGRDGLSRG